MNKYHQINMVAAFAAISMFTDVTAQYNIKSATPRFELPVNMRDGEDYISKTIIFKMKPQYRSLCTIEDINYTPLKSVMMQMGVRSFSKIYPNEEPPIRPYNAMGEKLVDLSLMYEYVYTSELSLQQALDKIAALGVFEYVEPHVIPKLLYNVNDPSASSQYHIAKISAPQAWNISKGDTNVVIGIVDTGTEPNHPDLKNNIKHNYADKIDGIDNDADGYIDNFSGWDIGMGDNDPTWQSEPHGVHVSGIAAASTDNSTGIAGVGFKCKFLPVKVSDASGKLTGTYIGIQYAAAHGCKVISCSWGGTGGQYGQDIVNYATINKDALVVAAAGNTGDEALLYPAYYPNALGVAGTTSSDTKAAFSSYNYRVRICAPGASIYSTYSGGSYVSMSGTSMSTPCIAGAAAVVRSYFPGYSALQTAARLCVTADDIYALNSSALKNKLGSGRVNLYRALNDPAMPSISMTTRKMTDGNDDAFVINDTVSVTGIYTNFLAPTNNLTATLSIVAGTGAVTLLTAGPVNLGAIPTLGTGNNNGLPFKIKIKPTSGLNTVVTCKITYSDGIYTSFETFDIVVNVDYLNVYENDISTSITSKGMNGWNNSPPTQGLGFKYNGVNLMYDAGLMIGVPDSAVSDVIRGMTGISDKDFKSRVNIKRITTGALSDFDTDGYMSDSLALKPLWVGIHHKSYAWSTPADRKYIMYKYIIKNNGVSTLNNLFAGIAADWDIQGAGGDSNRTSYDNVNRMGYTYYTKANGYYAGIKLLSYSAPASAYAFDNIDGGTGINPNAGFSNLKKYTGLSTMRTDAGLIKPPGNDVMSLVSTGPIMLPPGDSVEVAFALLAGDNLADLKTSANNAQIKYDLLTAAPDLRSIKEYNLRSYPTPASGTTTIDINLPKAGRVELKLYNMIGQDIATIAAGEFTSGKHQFNLDVSRLNSGVYYYQLIAGDTKIVRKMVVSK
ncbi:MAG: S8 family peptidase [Bacteroidetes bacterium]|nr:S8 family peptidase [Bacteroidota bacterium]